MLLESLTVEQQLFTEATGWELKPEGACKGSVCIPFEMQDPGSVDISSIAEKLNMPLVQDTEFGLWALGPESIGSRALTDARAPEMCLPDVHGNEFRLSSLRGKKVIVYAWAPY